MKVEWNGIDFEEWAIPLEVYSFRHKGLLRVGIRVLVFEVIFKREGANEN